MQFGRNKGWTVWRAVTGALALLCAASPQVTWAAADVPPEASAALSQGRQIDLIVEYEAAAVDREALSMRGKGDRFDNRTITELRAKRYREIKDAVTTQVPQAGMEHLSDYTHLPFSFKRFKTGDALKALAARAEVRGIYLDRSFHAVATANLDLIKQPATTAAGYGGSGATVAVLDNGIDYTNAAFGPCTAPATPSATCKVAASVSLGTGTTDNSHGTNVSAVVLGVAPQARVAAVNVFSGTSASSSVILQGINWAISNRSTYNIVAMNMSLGDGVKYTATCSSGNPYKTAITNAISAGITVVAAAGNEAYTDGIAMPACTPGVVSVGAVYDNNYGAITWGSNLCTDSSTSADKVTCFSDSASFLTMLAPGAMITAAGITEAGTSQASPHVAGAVAVLRAAFPSETLSATLSRLTSNGVSVTDSRNGLVKPRLNLAASARPTNDAFVSRIALSGTSGTATGQNRLATTETGELALDANAAGHTAWWKWTAPASGQVSLNTHGSGFDTVLAVYTGTAVNALQPVVSNDNDGSANNASGVLFEAVAGTEYEIAVDGMNGAQGAVTLVWSLNSSPQANLSVSGIAGPTTPTVGIVNTYTVTVANAGPQTATNVVATLTLPADVSFVSSASGCTAVASTVTCPLGALASGGSASASVNLLWNALVAETLTASVTSDVPDATSANNTSGLQVTGASDADTPTLPQWAALMLGGLLLLMGRSTPHRHV